MKSLSVWGHWYWVCLATMVFSLLVRYSDALVVNLASLQFAAASSGYGITLPVDYLPTSGFSFLFQHGYNVWQDEIVALGGVPVGLYLNSSSVIFRITQFNLFNSSEMESVMKRIFVNEEFGYFPIAVSPITSDANNLVLSSFCETTKACLLFATFTAARSNFICQHPLPSDCKTRNKRVGQRRFDYTISTLFDASNVVVGFLPLVKQKQYQKIAIIATDSVFGREALINTAQVATSLAMAPLFTQLFSSGKVPTLEVQKSWVQSMQDLSVDALFIIAPAADALFCASFLKTMKIVNYLPKAVILAGCLSAVPSVDVEAKESNLIQHLFGAIPWDMNARGQEYRAYHDPGTGNVEPWGSTETEDCPQVYTRKFNAWWMRKFGATRPLLSRSFLILTAIGAHTGGLIQKSLEAMSSLLSLQNENRTISVEEMRIGSLKIWQPSLYGRMSLDIWGRSIDRPELVIQMKSNSDFSLITPLTSGNEPILPIPTWQEREYRPTAYQTETAEVVVLTVTIVCLFLVMLVMAVTSVLYNHPVIKTTTFLFCIASMIGSICCMASVLVWPFMYETNVTCIAKVFLLECGITLMLASVYVKTVRLWWIFIKGGEALRSVKITTTELFVWLAVIMSLDMAFVLLWINITPFTASTIVVDANRPSLNYEQCQSSTYVFLWVSISLKAIMVLVGVVLSWMTRNLPTEFNESKYIALVIYNTFFALLIGIPVLVINSSTDQRVFVYYFRSFVINALALSTPLLLMIPKFYSVFLMRTKSNTHMRKTITSDTNTENNHVERIISTDMEKTGAGASPGAGAGVKNSGLGEVQENASRKVPSSIPIPMPSNIHKSSTSIVRTTSRINSLLYDAMTRIPEKDGTKPLSLSPQLGPAPSLTLNTTSTLPSKTIASKSPRTETSPSSLRDPSPTVNTHAFQPH